MNYITRIKQIDQQIKFIRDLLKSGEHNAAGLSIWLKLGPDTETSTTKTLTMECAWSTTLILESLLTSLSMSRNTHVAEIRKLSKEYTEFLALEEARPRVQEGKPATGS